MADGLGVLSQECSLLEPVLCVLDQLSEVDHQAPRERSVHVEPLEQNLADLLLYERIHLLGLLEEAQKDLAELVGVTVRVAKLIDDAVQEAQTRVVVKLYHHAFYELEVLLLRKVTTHVLGAILVPADHS